MRWGGPSFGPHTLIKPGDGRSRRRNRELPHSEVEVAARLVAERRHRAAARGREHHDARRRPASGSEPGPFRAQGLVGIEGDRSEERSRWPIASTGGAVEPFDGIGSGEDGEQIAKLAR